MIFLGDLHNNIKHIVYTLSRDVLDNTNVIQIGDFGVGYGLDKDKTIHNLCILDEALVLHNCRMWIVRGNHDDPKYFKGELKEELNSILKNIVLVEDYEVHEIEGRNVLFVGGGISVNRKILTKGFTYWEDEYVKIDGKKIDAIKEQFETIDILVTHSAPMWCHPAGINSGLVREWTIEDPQLKEDLIDERNDLSNIFDDLNQKFKFKHHVYGHFHKNYKEKIVDCNHILGGIGDFFDLNRFEELENKVKIDTSESIDKESKGRKNI